MKHLPSHLASFSASWYANHRDSALWQELPLRTNGKAKKEDNEDHCGTEERDKWK